MATAHSGDMFPIVSVAALSKKYFYGGTSLDNINDDPDIQEIFLKITNAFSEWGFVYIVDHGIDSNDAFKVTSDFFKKEKCFKEQYIKSSDSSKNWGYIPYNIETFDKSRPFDLKECFNFFSPSKHLDDKMEKIKEFVNVVSKFKKNCQILATLLLRVLTPVLSKDDKFLVSKHDLDNDDNNPSALRLLNYPSIGKEGDILEKQLRCGEHSDYGTITLLFQDEVGGLQVVSPSGEYVDAVPVPGSIVVNVGDMMERWTSGKFKSTRHRVLIENKHEASRQSIAYFVHPDKNVDVFCLDGSDKYKNVNSFEYLLDKFRDTY